MFPFQNKLNKDAQTVTIETRRYVLLSHQIVCLDKNIIIFL